MKNSLYIIGLGILITSCGGDSEKSNQTTDSTVNNSIALLDSNIVIDVDALLAKFTLSSALPYVQDSSLLLDAVITDSTALTANEATYLSYGFVENSISYLSQGPIQDFLFFDSLKTSGEYETYVEVADIGMMVRSEAFVAQEIVVDDSTTLLLWCVSYATYEACPYASGTVLYASILRNNAVTSCTIIGEDSAGADAPVWSETRSLASLKVGNFSVWVEDRNCGGDVDEEGNDMVDESSKTFKLTITPQGAWEVVTVSDDV